MDGERGFVGAKGVFFFFKSGFSTQMVTFVMIKDDFGHWEDSWIILSQSESKIKPVIHPLSQRNHGLVHSFPDGWLQSILTTTPLFLSFMLRQHDDLSLWESKRSGGREERGEPGDRRCRRRHLPHCRRPHRRHPQLEANQHGCGNVFDDDIEEVIV